jgi:hypothetical protein
MILWPSVLPQNISGYSGAPGDGLIRTSMSAGPPKTRRRFTAVMEPVSGYIIVTPEQFTFFRYWYDTILLNGALRFGWVHPFSGLTLANLINNGSFDSATTGWTPNDAALASVSGGIWGKCLEITSTGGDNQHATQTITLIPGNVYSCSSYVKIGTSVDTLSEISIIDLSSGEMMIGIALDAGGSWRMMQSDFFASDSDAYVRLMKNSAHAASPGTMLFDQVSLVDITTGVVEMQFLEHPSYSSYGGRLIKISMKLGILP